MPGALNLGSRCCLQKLVLEGSVESWIYEAKRYLETCRLARANLDAFVQVLLETQIDASHAASDHSHFGGWKETGFACETHDLDCCPAALRALV